MAKKGTHPYWAAKPNWVVRKTLTGLAAALRNLPFMVTNIEQTRTIGQQREMGTLEQGKLANIAFLAKDPLADIASVKSVTLTLKRGKEFPRSAFRPITRDEAKDAE